MIYAQNKHNTNTTDITVNCETFHRTEARECFGKCSEQCELYGNEPKEEMNRKKSTTRLSPKWRERQPRPQSLLSHGEDAGAGDKLKLVTKAQDCSHSQASLKKKNEYEIDNNYKIVFKLIFIALKPLSA